MGLEQEIKEIEEVVLSDEDEAAIDEAMRNARDPEDEDVAVAASFDVQNRFLLLELKTGQRIAIPQEDIQDLSQADPGDLAEVQILGPGTALHWEKVMEGAEVSALRQGSMAINAGWTGWHSDGGSGSRRQAEVRRLTAESPDDLESGKAPEVGAFAVSMKLVARGCRFSGLLRSRLRRRCDRLPARHP